MNNQTAVKVSPAVPEPVVIKLSDDDNNSAEPPKVPSENIESCKPFAGLSIVTATALDKCFDVLTK